MAVAKQFQAALVILSFVGFVAVVYIFLEVYQRHDVMSGLHGAITWNYSQIGTQTSKACHPSTFIAHPSNLEEKPSNENLTVITREFFEFLASKLRDTPYPGIEDHTSYVLAQSRRKPLSHIKPLRPEFGPVLNDVTFFQYPITIKPCKDNAFLNNASKLFVAVISAPDYFHKRTVIRQTWLRHLLQQTDLGSVNLIRFAFILGLTNNQEIQRRIDSENAMYGDILQIQMFDDYYNLTLKVVGLLNWINDNCSLVDFVLKADDDVYVNVQNLVTVLKTLNSSEQSMYGSLAEGVAYRDGKWSISYEDWPWSNYPVYFRGAAVLMPGSTIKSLLAASQTTPYFPFDDTYLCGLCSGKAGVKVRICDRFFLGGAPGIPEPCHVYTSITWLTDDAEHLNRSHWATENFYKNVTQCIISKGSDGINQTVDPATTRDFSFST